MISSQYRDSEAVQLKKTHTYLLQHTFTLISTLLFHVYTRGKDVTTGHNFTIQRAFDVQVARM
jgi:hypothetical protein